MSSLDYYQIGGKLTEVSSLWKDSIVAAQPKFEEVNDAPHHRLLPFYHRRQVDLDLVFKDIRVDPYKDFFFVCWEDHILIDDEISLAGFSVIYSVIVNQLDTNKSKFKLFEKYHHGHI